MVYKMRKFIRAVNRIMKEERGQVLPLVLIMLVLGSTIVAGSLTYAATTVKVGYDSKTNQTRLYSADAGAKEAIWRFKNDYFVTTGNITIGGGSWIYQPAGINNETLEITDEYVAEGLWKVTSVASSGGTTSTVELYLSGVSVFFTNTAVAHGTIDNKGVLNPLKYLENYNNFPTTASLEAYYHTPALTHTNNVTIDTTSNPSIGNMYYNNGLAITGTGIVTLTGNLYVNGSIDFTNDTWTINLNGHTIYATGDLTQAKKKGYFDGPGCIIAEGNIGLWPQSSVGYEDKFVFIMSVAGSVTLKPNGNFYGSVAAGVGGVSLTMQPGATVNLTTLPAGGLDFPDDPTTYGWSVSNWQSKRTTGVAAALAVSTGPSLPQGEVGIAYSKTLTATGGTAPYSNWLVTAGSLPAGLTLTPATGIISGTPTTANTFTFTVQVTDAVGATATKALTLTINSPIDIPNQLLDEGEVSIPYSDTPTANQGVPPYTPWSWTGAGSLPAGLTINSSGVISGTPTTAATYNFSIQVVDSLGGIDIQPLSITVYPKVTISTASLPNGKKNKAYGAAGGVPVASVFLTATNGKAPYNAWSMSGNPPNLSRNPATGQLTGDLKAADVGTWTITFGVTDNLGATATKTLTITVNN